MTRDDIIRMAREAGIRAEPGNSFADDMYFAVLYRFATMAFQAGAAAEREACAKVCEAIAQQMEDEGEGPTGYIGWVIDCVAAIKARSKT